MGIKCWLLDTLVKGGGEVCPHCGRPPARTLSEPGTDKGMHKETEPAVGHPDLCAKAHRSPAAWHIQARKGVTRRERSFTDEEYLGLREDP